jgi:hypothetical protein
VSRGRSEAPLSDPQTCSQAGVISSSDGFLLTLMWHGAVVDVMRVDRLPWRRQLLCGATLSLTSNAGAIEAVVDDGAPRVVEPSSTIVIADGVLLEFAALERLARAKPKAEFDSRLFHTGLIAAAFQVCLVSALLLAPQPLDDGDGGGGLPLKTLTRLVRAPGGAAPRPGAEIHAVGRPADDAERPTQFVPTRGARSRHAPVKPTESLAEAIAAIERAVHRGSPVGELKETLGDLARSTARAPEKDAGIGGLLRPLVLPDKGVSSGEIGNGAMRIKHILRREDRLVRMAALEPLPPRTTAEHEVPVVDEPDVADLDVEVWSDGEGLDPIVKDHISTAVRRRQNAVRACYESYGLSQDAARSGRVVLFLTLSPDGNVVDPEVTTDEPELAGVARCLTTRASEWFLGAGLVDAPVRLSFPFLLQPRTSTVVIAEDEAW